MWVFRSLALINAACVGVNLTCYIYEANVGNLVTMAFNGFVVVFLTYVEAMYYGSRA